MQKDITGTIGKALNQEFNSGKEDLIDLSERMAIWAIRNTVNNNGSRLRERGLALAGAIHDWADELYSDE